MRKKFLLTTLLIGALLPLQLFAQKASLTNVKKVSLKNISAIRENAEVKGYVAFYLLDKKNSKESNFKLNIWDANLTLKYDINFARPTTTYLFESSFNDETFCFSFFNSRDKKIECVMFGQDGKQVGTYTTPKVSAIEAATFAAAIKAGTTSYPTLVGLPTVGFARYGFDPTSDTKSIVTVFGKEGKVKWSATYAGKEAKNYATAYSMAHDENLLVSSVMVRESKYSQKISEQYLKFHDAKTGKELFTFGNKKGKYQYSVSRVTSDNDKIFMYGEYFNLEDNIIKDDSKGLFVLTTDKTGNIQKENYTSWEDILKIMPTAMLNDKGKRVKICMQEIIKTADNNYFIVCEQFYRTADGMAIASNVLNGGYGANVTKINLQDLVVLQFDADFKFKKGNVVSKNKTSVGLPPGMDFYGTPFIAFYVKATGQFDYCFTNESADKKTFNSIYVNYYKEPEKGKRIIGAISYNKDKEFVEDKINLTSNPTSYIALPATAGYVTIFEYFSKTKTIDIRRERLNM